VPENGFLEGNSDTGTPQRRRIQLLEQAVRLLYKEWFVDLRFPGHEHVAVIDGVPEGWEKKPLSEIADIPMAKVRSQSITTKREPGFRFIKMSPVYYARV